jgi:hypothetical protein
MMQRYRACTWRALYHVFASDFAVMVRAQRQVDLGRAPHGEQVLMDGLRERLAMPAPTAEPPLN